MRYDFMIECLIIGFCMVFPFMLEMICDAIDSNCIIFSCRDRERKVELERDLKNHMIFLDIKHTKRELFRLKLKRGLDKVIHFIRDFGFFQKGMLLNILAFILDLGAIMGAMIIFATIFTYPSEKALLKQFEQYKTFVEQKETITLKDKILVSGYNEKIMGSFFIDKDKLELIDEMKINKEYLKGFEKDEISGNN